MDIPKPDVRQLVADRARDLRRVLHLGDRGDDDASLPAKLGDLIGHVPT